MYLAKGPKKYKHIGGLGNKTRLAGVYTLFLAKKNVQSLLKSALFKDDDFTMKAGDVINPALTIKIRCPNLRCRTILSVPVDRRGKCVVCQECGQALMIPATPKMAGKTKPSKGGDGMIS